jgi:hypothetical protein
VGAIWLVAIVDIRRRWFTVVVLSLIVGLVGMAGLAAVAGARRTSASLGAFEQQSRSADVELEIAGQPTSSQLGRLRDTQGVEAIGGLRAFGLVLPGDPDLEDIGTPFAQFGSSVDRGRLIIGRFADPTKINEVTIDESLANRLHVGVGGNIPVESYSPEQISAILHGSTNVGALSGPSLKLQVVGIDRRPLDLSDQAEVGGWLILTPAFDRAYAHRIGIFGTGLRVRTYRGEADVPGVIASARHIFGGSVLSTQGLSVEKEGARSAITVLATALWISAGVAALAGSAIIAIGLSRESDLVRSRERMLRSLGFTRRQQLLTALPFDLLVAGIGAVVAVGGSVALSPLFPVGVARQADPEVGWHADPLVMAFGVALLVGIVLLIGLTTSYRATAPVAARSNYTATGGRLTFSERLAHAGLGPTASNGARMAFASGDTSPAVPVRSAHLGSIFGVLALTAALLFTTNLHLLAASPGHYGWTWDFEVLDTSSNTPCGGSTFGLARVHGLASVSEVCFQNVQIDSRPESALSLTSLRGKKIDPKVILGHSPRNPDEVALGAATMRDLGKRLGDRVRVQGLKSSYTYTIVGQTVLPSFGQAQPIDDGAVFTGSGFAPLFDPNIFSRYFVGTYSAGADRLQVSDRISAIPGLSHPSGPTLPVEVSHLQQTTWFPLSMAFLLGGLALVTVGSTLVVSIRRRRREFAVLKTLGFTSGQVGSMVAWEATAFAVTAASIGIPGGLLVGRFVWHLVAHGLGIQTTVVFPIWVCVCLVAGTFLGFNLIALIPGRLAARIRPADALRTE